MTTEDGVRIAVSNRAVIDGDFAVPRNPAGVVVFAHGSGSSRHSPRNRMVAERLQERGFGTLLVDLLTVEEETVDARTRHLRFDIGLLADRLTIASRWVRQERGTAELPIGYFGASTGAAAALVAAARQPGEIGAIVSRGGRPDLAADLQHVTAPTLLVVGALDDGVIALNRQAHDALPEPKGLVIVPGATHLFEEPGALEEVARLAGDWFAEHLAAQPSPSGSPSRSPSGSTA
jgi:putative phosphoribosyl transferase